MVARPLPHQWPVAGTQDEPLLFRLAKLTTSYYQAHQYQPTHQDRQIFAQQKEVSMPSDGQDEKQTALKSWAVLRHYPYQVMAYMRAQLREAEFSLFVKLMEIV